MFDDYKFPRVVEIIETGKIEVVNCDNLTMTDHL